MSWGPSEDDQEDREGATGGWVPPEARTWRHPSELRAAQVAVALATANGWRRGASVLVGSAALVAIAFGAVLLANTGSTPTTATLATMPVRAAVTPCCRLSAAATRDAEAAVVSIEPVSTRALAPGCGVMVGEGLVATTVAALDGARRVRVVAATGRVVSGSVVAQDRVSDIVLLRTSATLPAVPATGGGDVTAGSSALAVAMRSSPGATPRAVWTSGTVVSVGVPAPGISTTDMAEITVRGSTLPDMPGEPLVDQQGHVLGILAGSDGSDRSFLPMSLVDGVIHDLATVGKVHHGWLDVKDTTATDMQGAKVVWVDPKGAAANVLWPGDVIVSVNGQPVSSSAALSSMLYVMPPGTKVTIVALRSGRVVESVVQLHPSP